MKILVCDPGKKTGVVETLDGKLQCSYTLEYQKFIEHVLEYKWIRVDLIIAEEFRIYPWAAHASNFQVLYSPKILGMLELISNKHHIPLILQWASNAKQSITDTVLKENSWWERLKNAHERDAGRHALMYLKKGEKTCASRKKSGKAKRK